jgi:integrase
MLEEKLKAKYTHLLEDKDVRRWFDNLKAKSIVTATVYLRTLGLYCELNKTDPKAILKAAKTKAFRDGFTDFIRRMEEEGKAGSYLSKFKKALNSWLSYNGLNVKLKVNIRGESETPTIASEKVPSKEELDRILRMATPRARVSISLMAFSGIRPHSLGNYDGSDGIRLGDFVEAEISESGVEFAKVPTMLVVRKSLSKAGHQYFTFVPQQAITYIKEYLNERVKQGEKLSKDSPLLSFDPRGVRKNRFLRTTLVTRDIREAISKAGFNWRPYVLRAYCDTNMIIAESKGKISHPYLQFLMGHKGDIEARYSTNKGVLPPEMIEDMRKCYKECEPFLTTTAQPLEQSSVIKEAKIEALKSIAKSLLGIDLA